MQKPAPVPMGNVGMFDNSYFDNSFGFVQQFKNGLFFITCIST